MDTVEQITDRQLEVARLIAEGRSNPEIADTLGVSLAGAKYHVSELLGRLGVTSREEVAAWYRRREGIPARRGWRERARMLVPVGAILGAVAGAAIVSIALSGGRDDSGLPVAAVTETPAAVPTESAATTPLTPNVEKVPLFWEYMSQPGDSVASIAMRFGISQEAIIWNNIHVDVRPLPPGTRIQVPTVDGVVHSVREDETVKDIAATYHAEERDILDFPGNGLDGDPDNLEVGSLILVPGGTKTIPTSPPTSRASADAWVWPVDGDVTAEFSPEHPVGIDILAPLNTEIRATRAGKVTFVGGDPCCDKGYHVIIEHDDGYTSLYAHLGGFRVEPGQSVEQSEGVGTVGMTGRTAEPHLHFEIHRNGVYQDPLSFLP